MFIIMMPNTRVDTAQVSYAGVLGSSPGRVSCFFIIIIITMHVFAFNVPSTAKIIWRCGHDLKCYLTDW